MEPAPRPRWPTISRATPSKSSELLAQKTAQADWSILFGEDSIAEMATAAASLLDAETFSASSERDALGRVLTAVSPDGSEVHYHYDEGGALQRVTLHHRGSATEQTPQRNYRSNPLNLNFQAPKVVDPRQPGLSLELPPIWAAWRGLMKWWFKEADASFRREPNMIVATLFKETIRWFDSDPDYWVLDYSKWGESFKDAGYDVDASDCSDRFDLPVVDEKTAALFLDRMKESIVSSDELRNQFLDAVASAECWDDVAGFLPSLFVDFDHAILWSLYSEGVSFESYVPPNWRGVYEDFLNQIPAEGQYWMDNGEDLTAAFRHGQ